MCSCVQFGLTITGEFGRLSAIGDGSAAVTTANNPSCGGFAQPGSSVVVRDAWRCSSRTRKVCLFLLAHDGFDHGGQG